MKDKMRVMALTIFGFSSVHTYLWAFGIYEPKHDWFGASLLISFVAAALLFGASFDLKE